ncbi:MAG TPA: M20/M25/M40 family metallo-hydrolase [Acidobacteriota bacterium]|nr:M20/M25/M40 family metallo-hydrolase [Acidobacteriota bacterium]
MKEGLTVEFSHAIRKTVAFFLVVGSFSIALAGGDAPDFDRLAEEGINILSGYLKSDTSNPPGQELAGALYLAGHLERAGIGYRILESSPGRANLYARIKGEGNLPPIILLHHIDVVPATDERWAQAPFSGMVADGFIWGRGALDAKGLGVAQLMTLLSLKRSDRPLKRDVIYLATADEEQGGRYGVEWLLGNHFQLVENAELVLNEGGTNFVKDGKLAYIGVENHQKLPLWVRLNVRGQGGHGSIPHGDSANVRLIRALDRIVRYQPPLRVTPPVALYFRSVAPLQSASMRTAFANIEEWVDDTAFVRNMSPYFQSLLRDTINLTVLSGGSSVNVMPSSATAELDCRLLPDQDPDEFLFRLAELAGDPSIEMETSLKFEPTDSPRHSEIIEVIRRVTKRFSPDAIVGPSVLPGFTDSHHFREKGIPAYGFSPFKTRGSESASVHGTNERLALDDFRFGVQYLYSVVAELVY